MEREVAKTLHYSSSKYRNLWHVRTNTCWTAQLVKLTGFLKQSTELLDIFSKKYSAFSKYMLPLILFPIIDY